MSVPESTPCSAKLSDVVSPSVLPDILILLGALNLPRANPEPSPPLESC